MKYRIISILSLLLITFAQAGPAVNTSFSAVHPAPIFIPDGASIITSGLNSDRLNDIIDLSKDIYPIQIGAFRLKSNAEAMYGKVAMVLGDEVKMI